SGGDDVHVFDLRDFCGGGYEVVHEGGRQRGAILVDGKVLEQHAGYALDGAAGDLAFDEVGVDRGAAVLGHDVAEQPHVSGLDVDFAGADVSGVRPVASHGLVTLRGLEAGGSPRGQPIRLKVRQGGDLGEGDALSRRPSNRRAATGQLDIVGR